MNLKVKISSCIFLFLAGLIIQAIGMSEFCVAHKHEHFYNLETKYDTIVHNPVYENMNEYALKAIIGGIRINSRTRPEDLQRIRYFIENDHHIYLKDCAVKDEVADALFILEKCGDAITLPDIDELYISGSSVVNSEFQKLKYNIQQIIYNKDGEFRGIKNKEDIEKIQKAIEKFEKFMWKWHHNHRAIYDASIEENCSSNKPYKPDWNKQIRNNFYNQNLFRAISLCKNGEIEAARKIVQGYKFNKNLKLEDKNNIKYAHLDYIVSKFEMNQYCKDGNIEAAKQILDRYETMYVGRWRRIGENESIVSQHYTNLANIFYPAKQEFVSSSITSQADVPVQEIITTMPKTLATNIQLLQSEKDLWDEFKTELCYEARLKSWQENIIQANKFTTKNYELTPEALNLFKQLGLDSKAFSMLYGNQIQHAIHQEFVDIVNNAGLIYLKTNNEESRELAKEIITCSDAGSSYLKAGFILKATYTANFCWALLDCGIAMSEGAVQGLKNTGELLTHPIETATKLSQAIFDAGYYLGKILTTLVNDGIIAIKNPEEAAIRIEQRVEKINTIIQAIEDKLKTKQPRDIAKKSTEIIVESWCTGKILSFLAKFLKDSNNKFSEIIKKLGPAEEAVALTSEGLPVQVRIAEEAVAVNDLNKIKKIDSVISQLKNSTKRYKTIINTNEKCRLSRPVDYSKLAEWEKEAYNKIRQLTNDIEKISENTGISKDKILKIKQHLFHDEHLLRDGTIRRFDADHEIAEAWDRLINNDFIKNDLNLLEHEYCEAIYMQSQNTKNYELAHKFAQEKFPWFANEYI